jgi:hypothetical protein
MNYLTIYVFLIIAGFILGWAGNNAFYGTKECDECLAALIRGKKCSECKRIDNG